MFNLKQTLFLMLFWQLNFLTDIHSRDCKSKRKISQELEVLQKHGI